MALLLAKKGGRVLAFCLALLVFMPGVAAPLTPAGTTISHGFSVHFGPPPGNSANSNQTQVTVKDLADPTITPARNAATPAGQPVDLLHTVCNRGNSADSFQLKASLVQGVLPQNPPKMQFFTADGKTALPVDSTGIPWIGPIAPGASLDLVLRVTPPPGSEGSVDTIAVTAVSLQFPVRNATLSDQLVVPMSGGLAAPVKSVTPAGPVPPATVLTYSIALANAGPAPVAGVRVSDRLDPLLDYQQGSALFPDGLSGTATYDAGSRTLIFSAAEMPAGFSGTVSFQARVRSDAPGNSSILNTASILSDALGTPLPSNGTLTPVDANAIRISKLAGSAVAEAGDIVSYTVQVENLGAAPLSHLTVFDRLPRGFRYLKGTSLIDGMHLAEPTGAGAEVSWDVGTLEVGAVRVLGYACTVSAEAPVGTSVNWAQASGSTPAGGSSVSLKASASVKVRPSILGDKAIILGRIFEDRNGNGLPDPGEPGVPGVRIYLEDGSFVISDREGQYSFTGVSAGNHVLKIDRSTLAPRYRPVPFNTAFAGVGWSQFVTVPFGGPVRGDFALAVGAEPEKSVAPAGPSGALPPPAARSAEGAVPGAAATLRVTPQRVDMPADGKSVVPFTVELLNGEGKRVSGKRSVTVSIGKGAIVEPDADPTLPGHQIGVTDGMGVFRVRSPMTAGPDQVLIGGENGVKGRVDLYFSQELRDWIVVGLGSLNVGARGVSGHIEKIDQEDRFSRGIYHEERLAFFTRGRILGKYLLTAAYDSEKERRDGVFQAIDPEKYYPVYGDASDIGYEAQSRGKIYVKIESGRSYLMAGDYRTDLSENEFSRYDRALNGAKLEVNNERLSVKGFESRTDQALIKDEIPGNGSSGYYQLSQKPVFENSERVRIEARDRYHSERVVSVTEKMRFSDYTIDYNAGTILFKEPVPSLDQNLNPVTIVVNYQSQGGGAERYVYGGRALLTSEGGSYLGGTAVVEQGTERDSTLYGLDAGIKIGDRLSLKGEGAVSDTPDKGRGSAWKTELNARPLDSLNLSGYYRRVQADFFNSSMTGNETGTEKYGGRLDYRGFPGTLLFAESFLQKNEIVPDRQFGNQVGLVHKFSLFEAEGGFKRVEETKDAVDGHSDLLYAGIRGPLGKRLEATLRREQLLAPSPVEDYQSKTFLKLDYRLSAATRAFVTEEYQEGSPAIRQSTRFGMESRLSERMLLTSGYRMSDGLAGSTEQSSVDLNTKMVDREGFSLNSRNGYQVENALSQQRGQAVLGLNSRFRIAEGLLMNSTLERVQTVQGSGGTSTAFTLAGEYLQVKDLKLTGRYEIRTGAGETASLYGAGGAYKVLSSLTLLGKANYWDKDAAVGEDRVFDGYLGTSWRPLAGNPLQLLTLVRYKLDDKASVPGSGENRSLILSAEPTYRIVKDWSTQGKYAGKFYWLDLAGNGSSSYTDLMLVGLSYDLVERWELSAYLKLLNQYDTGQHSFGGVASVGYRVYRNVVLSAGYNYARLDDRDLSGESFQGQGPFFGVKVKFDEDMFDLAQSKVIPLPAPARPVAVAEPPAPPSAAPPPRRVPALLVAAARLDEPLLLSGSAELLTLLINGEPARLPSTAVTVGRQRLDGSVVLRKGKLASPLVFLVSVEKPELVASWSLKLTNGEGATVRTIKGNGAPPQRIPWSGETDAAGLREGGIYQYQLRVGYRDGSVFSTAIELFGVNRSEAMLLTLGGGAFVFDSARLTNEAKRLLKKAASVLRANPREQVVLEGHTDGIGTLKYNRELSRRRCQAAADFLVREQAIAASRLIKRWYGKERPIADNATIEGRRLNRRVELRGDFQQAVPVEPKDRYRGVPFVTINDRSVPLDQLGRFETTVPAATEKLEVEMGDSLGRSLGTTLPVPAIRLVEPEGEKLVLYGASAGGIRVDERGTASCTISGGLDKGVTLELDGKALPADGNGRFAGELPLAAGEQVFGMVLRNEEGCSRLINLKLRSTSQSPVADRLQP